MPLPTHVIDACVLFGPFDTKNRKKQELCKKYLSDLGHRFTGVITVPLLGEIFLAISKMGSLEGRNAATEYIFTFLREGALTIIPIKGERDQHVEKLKEINQELQDDDATHLSNTIQSGEKTFVTVDQALIGKKAAASRVLIKQETGLDIYHPEEQIKILDIR